MSRAKSFNETVLSIKLQKGLADRKRLPLVHVISVLEEVSQMIAEVGRDLQRQKGIPSPTGEFGLEILAGSKGLLFLPGSLQAHLAITQDVQTGILAAQRVVRTVRLMEEDKFPPAEDEEINAHIVRRLNRIARIQELDKIEMHLAVKVPGYPKSMEATFGTTAVALARSLQAPTFRMEEMTLYGKLFELTDRSTSEEEEGKFFWGELRRENGETWRVQFRASDVNVVTGLFRKQVAITGTAFYYRVASPKLVAEKIEADPERDFETAFEDLQGCYKDIYKADFPTLMRRMHGEE